jgi:CBS domain-containing protein
VPNAFNFAASPFDCLGAAEKQLVRAHVDIAYFREGETLLERGDEATHLFIVVKGHVSQLDGDEVVATYGRDDCFDGRSLVAGRASHRFVAAEEVIAYQLARQAVNSLIAGNATFGALLFSDLSLKLAALAERHSQREMQSLATAKVEQAFLRPAHVVPGDTDIVAVARMFRSCAPPACWCAATAPSRAWASSPPAGCSARSSTAGRSPSCECASSRPSR